MDRSVAITMIIGFILLTILVGVLARMVSWLGRPTIPTAPPTPELLDTPPAVVNLIMSGLAGAPEAGAATLLDLAARGILELHQPGDDPEGTTVTVRRTEPAGLSSYERRVLQRVTPPPGIGPFTLADLDRRHAENGHEWHARVEADVRTDAVDRGLLRAGGQPPATTILIVGFVVLTVLSCFTGVAIMEFLALDDRLHPIAVVAGLGVLVLVLCGAAVGVTSYLAGDARGERLTPEGSRVPGIGAASRRGCAPMMPSPTCPRRRSPSGTGISRTASPSVRRLAPPPRSTCAWVRSTSCAPRSAASSDSSRCATHGQAAPGGTCPPASA